MSTDVDGVFYGSRAALPHLEKTKGSIVNTASVSGTGGDWGMSPYNAAKGAVVNLTRALRECWQAIPAEPVLFLQAAE